MNPVGVAQKLAPLTGEIARPGPRREILMAALRECSGWDQVGTVRGMTDERIRPAVAADVDRIHYRKRLG